VNNSTLTKRDIIKNLVKKTGLSTQYSKKLINDLLEILILNIKNDNLILKNIGKFKIIKKKKRFGRNPKTKEEFIISARKSLSFISSKNLSNIINQRK
jgi:integration host factor subunit alpha